MNRYYQNVPRVDAGGRQHYTGLLPGQLAKGVLLPGDPHRSKVISELFLGPEFQGRRGTYAAYTGKTPGGEAVSVISSGMGCMCVANAMEEMAHLGVQTVIRVGTCGGVQPGYQPGTVVIATGCVRGDGASFEYAPAEFPAVADYRVVAALHKAAKEFGEQPVLGLYRSHDAFYMESMAAHEGLRERMQPWIDTNVQVVENESGTLFVMGHLLGIRTGTICVALGSMFDDSSEAEVAYSVYQDPAYMKERIATISKIAIRAVELLASREDK